jgi:DNA-binding transcriptional MocR family regulator
MREPPGDRPTGGPRYLRVYSALRERLRSGVYPPGQRLPNQLQLAREFGVSFMTLRRAVELLERDGYLLSRHGIGTFAVWQPDAPRPVLVVDHQAAARARLRAVLEAEGEVVVEAAESDEALAVAQQAAIERAFVDASAARSNGIALLPRLRALVPEVRIILLWSGVEELAALDDQEPWPAIVLRKPWQTAQVRAALRLSGRLPPRR